MTLPLMLSLMSVFLVLQISVVAASYLWGNRGHGILKEKTRQHLLDTLKAQLALKDELKRKM